MNAAIFYHPEAYTTGGPKLMGRNAAGESFLRGFLEHSKSAEFWVQVQKVEHARHFEETVKALGHGKPVRIVVKQTLHQLATPGLVYYPGPGIGDYAFHRAAFGHGAWSLCGITHTTSSAGAMDALADLITKPVQPWDALICTSTAVKDNVKRLLQAQVDYLQDRLGITRLVMPQLPVIPLGIHTKDFAFTEAHRATARTSLGIPAESLVVLFMGRLSFHAKAHPLAMYQALELARQNSNQEVVLIECGWHANDFIKQAYEEAARKACPSIKVITLDGRKAEDRQAAWAGADVFCSLSDNIQETFGIVPIEAMAAGLPVVVSDWDGYRDTVRDGVDGFRVPTIMPKPGLANDLALRHALEIDSYDMYCGHTCSLVAIDVQACAQAFGHLFKNPALRREMGEAGRKRAIEVYDWQAIIAQYESLWTKLAEVRAREAQEIKPIRNPWPARMDPFHAFASYPTHMLTEQTALALVDSDASVAIERTRIYRQMAMVDFAKAVLPTEPEFISVLEAAGSMLSRHEKVTAESLLREISPLRRAQVFRALTWLLKLGVLRVIS